MMKLYEPTKKAILDTVKEDYGTYTKVLNILETSEQTQREAQKQVEQHKKKHEKQQQREQNSLREIAKSKRIVKR